MSTTAPQFTRAEVEAIHTQSVFLVDWHNTSIGRFPLWPHQRLVHRDAQMAATFFLDVMDGLIQDIESVSANDALWNAIDPVWINYSYTVARANALELAA